MNWDLNDILLDVTGINNFLDISADIYFEVAFWSSEELQGMITLGWRMNKDIKDQNLIKYEIDRV